MLPSLSSLHSLGARFLPAAATFRVWARVRDPRLGRFESVCCPPAASLFRARSGWEGGSACCFVLVRRDGEEGRASVAAAAAAAADTKAESATRRGGGKGGERRDETAARRGRAQGAQSWVCTGRRRRLLVKVAGWEMGDENIAFSFERRWPYFEATSV